ncbi:MAG: Ig domain-containing protein [Verrucomicrobiaceae bacterium]|nr:Ig domain-containing protein [Verrucomicrobiaceae bacterium]
MLAFELPLAPVAQGSSFDGALLLPAGFTASALVIDMEFPPGAFDSVEFDRGTGLSAADKLDKNGPAGERGIARVVITRDGAGGVAGPAELLVFRARLRGRRGAPCFLRARLLSGADADLIAFDAEVVEGTVFVAAGSLGVVTTALERANRGQPWHEVLIAEGGQPPYHWRLASGALPGGVTLGEGGVISGVPGASGTFPVTFAVSDSAAPAAGPVPCALDIVVTAPLPQITTEVLPVAAAGHAYAADLAATGGAAPYRWSANGLPAGLAVVGSQIVGMPEQGVPTGEHVVELIVEDSTATPPLTASRMVALELRSALQVARHVVADVSQVHLAPNLLVVDYELDAEVNVVVAAGPGVRETQEIIDRAMEEIVSAIVSTDCLDGPPAPTPPPDAGLGVPGGFGPPDRSPLPGDRLSCREKLTPLLDEYRDLRNARRTANVLSKGITVVIDGTPVYTHTDGLAGKRTSTGRAAYAMRKTAQNDAMQQALKKDKDRKALLKHAQARIEALIKKAADQKHAAGAKTKSAKFKIVPKTWKPGAPVTKLVDDRIAALSGWISHIDWDALFPASGKPVIKLTTGPHRIEVSAFASYLIAPGSILGHMTAHSSTITSKVTLRPRNPEHWPRLDCAVVCQGYGGQFTQDVNLHPSDVDLLAIGRDGLSLMPATGDPAAPYAAPRPFQRQPGFAAQKVFAGVADDIGRTWVLASSGSRLAIIRNQGVGGFAQPHAHVFDARAGSIVDTLLLETGAGHVAAAVLFPGEVATVGDLAALAAGGAPSVVSTPVQSRVVHDEAAAFCRIPALTPVTADRAIAVVWLYSGTLTWHELGADGRPAPFHGVAPLDVVDLTHRCPAVVSFTDAGSVRLAAVATEARELLSWTFPDGIRPDLPDFTFAALPASPRHLQPAFGLGLALFLGPQSQVFLLTADGLEPLAPESGTSSMHGRGMVVALGRRSGGEVRILERR